MIIFEQFHRSGIQCPICGTNDSKRATLVPIEGTQDGDVYEAMLVHVDCINLKAYRENGVIVMGMIATELKQSKEQNNEKRF